MMEKVVVGADHVDRTLLQYTIISMALYGQILELHGPVYYVFIHVHTCSIRPAFDWLFLGGGGGGEIF